MFEPLTVVYHGLVHMAPPMFLTLTGASALATQLWPAAHADGNSAVLAARRTAAVIGAVTLLTVVLTMTIWTARAAAHGQL